MTTWLLDTNVALRLANPGARDHRLVCDAVDALVADRASVRLAAQVLIETWVVATRPTAVNGLGWSVERAAQTVRSLEATFPLLPETPAVFHEWLEIVSHGVSGKRAHDARLAAVMRVHGVANILTLNVGDFASFASVTPVHPSALATQ